MSDDHRGSADAEPLPPVGHPCTLLLRLHSYGIGTITLVQGRGDRIALYQTHALQGVLKRLPRRGEGADWFITLNAFTGPRGEGNLCSLRGNMLDLDFYKVPVWERRHAKTVWKEVELEIQRQGLPPAQMAIATGRGLQIYWVYPRGLPAVARSRWRAVQKFLALKFASFGADASCTDVARLVRLPGTINSRNGKLAHILHVDFDSATDLDEIARVLPLDRFELRDRRQKRSDASRTTRAPGPNPTGFYCRAMLDDIEALIQHRWAGRIPRGYRNSTIFLYATFLIHSVGPDQFRDSAHAYAERVCDLSFAEVETIIGSVLGQYLEPKSLAYGSSRKWVRGYLYSRSTAAKILGVSVGEAKAAGLKRLMPPGPERDQIDLAVDRAGARRRMNLRRRAAGVQRRQAGLKARRPWEDYNISRSHYFKFRSQIEHLHETNFKDKPEE